LKKQGKSSSEEIKICFMKYKKLSRTALKKMQDCKKKSVN